MEDVLNQANRMTQILTGELFKALGFSKDGLFCRMLSPLAYKPIHQFSKIAAGFDQQVKKYGFQKASQWILPNFIKDMRVSIKNHIPREGPLLITSNHPGAYDTLVITANMPRDDVKIIVNIPLDFINQLPETLAHFFYAPLDPHVRMNVVRQAIRHLKSGGALLLFGSGGIDPDPAYMPGTEEAIDRWSRSLDIFIRRVPETKVLISMVSGILDPKFINHPFTYLRKSRPDKQRISEFFQVMHQMLHPGKYVQIPKISFTMPFEKSGSLDSQPTIFTMGNLVSHAKQLLKDHLNQSIGSAIIGSR